MLWSERRHQAGELQRRPRPGVGGEFSGPVVGFDEGFVEVAGQGLEAGGVAASGGEVKRQPLGGSLAGVVWVEGEDEGALEAGEVDGDVGVGQAGAEDGCSSVAGCVGGQGVEDALGDEDLGVEGCAGRYRPTRGLPAAPDTLT